MSKEPEQVLIQKDISTLGGIEEVGIGRAVHQQHGADQHHCRHGEDHHEGKH